MNFLLFINRVLGLEDGYVNDPQDPGGETKWGISKRSYPDLDIKNLTREQAIEIYRRDFWEKIHADEIPDGVAYQALDFAVNSGIGTAIRYLQRALGVADDGYWGPVTRAAVASTSESDIIMRFVAERLRYWTSLSRWPRFGKGWARRAATDLYYGAEDS
jgi:lysozyme family protein